MWMDNKSSRDLQIIDFVRQNATLQQEETTRGNFSERETLWKELGSQLKCDPQYCKNRWVNIRAAFRNNLRKGRDVPYKYQTELSFLNLESIYKSGDHWEPDSESDTNNRSITSGGFDDTAPQSDTAGEEVSQTARFKRKKTRSQWDNDYENYLHGGEVEQLVEVVKPPPEDPLKLFFDAMCASTRRLNTENIQRVRRELFDLVSKLEVEEANAAKEE